MKYLTSESELEYFYRARPDADYRINYGNIGGPADRVHAAIDLAKALKIAYPRKNVQTA